VKRLFQLKQDISEWSLSKLAEALNEEVYRTAYGKRFTVVQVKRILNRNAFMKAFIAMELYGQTET